MHPFKTAERYMQLRKTYAPKLWVDTLKVFNDLIFTPLITLFLYLSGTTDLFFAVSNAVSVYNKWKEWIEYNQLKFQVQNMYLHTMRVGGPFITTNDSAYLPYVFADAVVRTTGGEAQHP